MRARIATPIALVLLLLLIPLLVTADEQIPPDTYMADTAGNSITDSGFSGVAPSQPISANATSPKGAIYPASLLSRKDYQDVYDEAIKLYETALSFRLNNLQLVPCTTENLDGCLTNYKNYKDGDLFYRFCASFEPQDALTPNVELNGSSSCREWDDLSDAEKGARIVGVPSLEEPKDVRNMLLQAQRMFGFLSLGPSEQVLNGVSVRELGRTGVLSATREIANVHLIFGNEFLVDASDYRFSGNDPRAEAIVNQEIRDLEAAYQQFKMAVDTLAYAFNADFGGPAGQYIGSFFGPREFDLFGIASERMVVSLGEMANRYRQLGNDQKAVELYADAFQDQYIQVLALTQGAEAQAVNILENGGWRLMNNLEQLNAKAQAIRDGINPFGFVDEYVPLQTYTELVGLLHGGNGFLSDATDDERLAQNAQREFDQNRSALNEQFQSLRLTYDRQLEELCGGDASVEDYYNKCDGGLMEQNYFAMVNASQQLGLTQQRLENLTDKIRIEEDRANQVINITLEGGQTVAATQYVIGVTNSRRTTKVSTKTKSDEVYAGAEVKTSSEISINPLKWGAVTFTASSGYRHSRTKTSSSSTVIDPQQTELGGLNGEISIEQAATQADIVGANSVAVIQNILLDQAELVHQQNIGLNEFNRLSAEHNSLVSQYHNVLNLKRLAQENLVDSYLNNPAYRIIRDSLTIEAARSHGLAAQFAYLAAKGLEYETLSPIDFLSDIYKARTADDIDNFLIKLEQHRVSLLSPGDRNRFPYRISVAEEIFGLTDENLDPQGTLSASQRADIRYAEFQQRIEDSVIRDEDTGDITGVEFQFTTSLRDNRIFSPNIWNNRIAGVGLPPEVPGTQGVSINVISRQFGDLGTPEVLLTHAGHATYRNITGELVRYTPENAKLAGYLIPEGFGSKKKTATILGSVNGNGKGTPSSGLFNFSIAASNWTLKIDLSSPFNNGLDLAQLEDIEIFMDTTGIAIPGRVQAAADDAAQLQQAASTR